MCRLQLSCLNDSRLVCNSYFSDCSPGIVKPSAFGVSDVSTFALAATSGRGGAAVARTSTATRLDTGAAARMGAPAGQTQEQCG